VKLPRGKSLWIWIAGLLLLLVAAGLVFGGSGDPRGSALSRGPNGWLAARRYLAARGAKVSLLDRSLEQLEAGGVLVSVFPWQRGLTGEAGEQLEAHLRRGGHLVLAYSGQRRNPAELVAFEGLGMPLDEIREVTLNPFRWRRFARAEWDLQPSAALPGAEPVRVWAPRWAPEFPKQARVLYRTPTGKPAIVSLDRYQGTIWLLPADAFTNARLGEAGNADLLETLRRQLGDQWIFDEYHHGLVAGRSTETEELGRTLDLVLLHLAFLYLVGLWALSRRFGPAWSEPTAVTGSTSSFLLGLGALHHRLGHHAEAARRLLARVREIDPDLPLAADLDRRAANAGSKDLLELAREVARLRRGGAASRPSEIETERETAA
jgi:hypothetical protein